MPSSRACLEWRGTFLAVSLAAAVLLVATGSQNVTAVNESLAGQGNPRKASLSTSMAARKAQVTITQSGLDPPVLTIVRGTAVTWYNSTALTHTLQSDTPTHRIYLPMVLKLAEANPIQAAAPAALQTGRRLASGNPFSATLPPGGTFVYVFAAAADYPYYLSTAPQLQGRVIVQAEPGSPAPPATPTPTPLPDPISAAPPVEGGNATNLGGSTGFLYSGANPIQTGVVSQTIDAQRAVVLRGKVSSSDGQPLPGVTVSVHNRPEYGQTSTRSDGVFDLAMNGGGSVTIDYRKDGYLPGQRQVETPWGDFVWLPDAALVAKDANVTNIDATGGTTIQVASGSVVSDPSGIRQGTLLFPQGLTATLTLPGGITQTLSSFQVRVTELSADRSGYVSRSGAASLPAPLPPDIASPYAFQISVDEADNVGAEGLTLSKPLIHYVDNFLGLPVGTSVPVGNYDQDMTAWAPSASGQVIRVVGVTNGMAELDIDGSGQPASETALAALGITDDERSLLASRQAGALASRGLRASTTSDPWGFWRMPDIIVSKVHRGTWGARFGYREDFTEWCLLGYKWACGMPPAPKQAPTTDPNTDFGDPCKQPGRSVIECQNQILTEAVNLAGTPFTLGYASDRTPGRKAALLIPLTGSAAPAGVKQILLEVLVAGRKFTPTFTPAPDLSYTFTWDGKDAYGRALQGQQTVTIRRGYVHSTVYQNPDTGEPILTTISPDRVVWQEQKASMGYWDARAQGLGGWTLNVHHAYDPVARTIYLGNGERRISGDQKTVSTAAGSGVSPFSGDGGPATKAQMNMPERVALGPDGIVYIADTGNNRIRRIGRDGVISTVSGGGSDRTTNGIPAAQAWLSSPRGLVAGADGMLYISHDWGPVGNVRRIGTDGLIQTVAGSGPMEGAKADGGQATRARIHPADIALGPDGSLYIIDDLSNLIRRVGADGVISTVAGGGDYGAGDGIPATQAFLDSPRRIAVGSDGSIYVSERSEIRRVGPDGIIRKTPAPYSEGGLALGSDGSLFFQYDGAIRRMAPDGTLTVAATGTRAADIALAADAFYIIAGKQILRVLADGTSTTIAGWGAGNYFGDGGPATKAGLDLPADVAVAPDGSLYIADFANHLVRRVGRDGIITTVAGNGSPGCTPNPRLNCFGGDGGPATEARLYLPQGVAVGPDGTLYIADRGNNRIRRVKSDGTVYTVAGADTAYGEGGFAGDGGPAIEAQLKEPTRVAVGRDGTLYIADTGNNRIRRVGPDGTITTVAGTGLGGFAGDGGPGTQARVGSPEGVAVGPNGSLYVADTGNNRVRQLAADGTITTVAGGGAESGDGISATAATLSRPQAAALGPDGSLYFTETPPLGSLSANLSRVRRLGTDGTLTTLAGGGTDLTDGVPTGLAGFSYPQGLAFGPDGSLYVADPENSRIRRVAPLLPGLSATDLAIASADGNQLYVFDGSGRHLRTVNTGSGAEVYRFTYDSTGRLSQVTDGDSLSTMIERDAAGKATAITGPFGQRTGLTLDANGYLEKATDAAGGVVQLSYSADGLLTGLTDPRSNLTSFTYDSLGRLTRDQDPTGGFSALGRTESQGVYSVTLTSGMGRNSSYLVEKLPSGATRLVNTDAKGARTEVKVLLDGTRQITGPDGTVSTLEERPSPLWGMAAPLPARREVTTPGGSQMYRGFDRKVTLTDPGNPLSLATQTDKAYGSGFNYIPNTYTRVWDASSRTYTETSPLGRKTITRVDAQGRTLEKLLDANLDPVTFTYDSYGRMTQTARGSQIWAIAYDAQGRVAIRSDPAGRETRYAYDAVGRVISTILPSGRTYRFTYDANGNRTKVIMPSGAEHSMGYDAVNLEAAYTPPGSLPSTTTANLDRQRMKATLPSGRAVEQSYDVNGRLVGTSYPEATITYVYTDTTSRPRQVTRSPAGGGTTQRLSYKYDGDLPTSVSWTGVTTGTFTYTYDDPSVYGDSFTIDSFDLDGSMSLSGVDRYVILKRDTDGLLTRYGPVFTFARGGPAGAVSEISDNNLRVSLSYDLIGRVVTRTNTLLGQPFYQAGFTYDSVGRIVQKVELAAGTTYTYSYAYDLDGQLTQVSRNGTVVEQYSYDVNGNRSGRRLGDAPAETANYDTRDRLTQRGQVSYEFDQDGFLTRRGGDTFRYSARGELISVNLANGQDIGYHYDGLGRQVARTDASGTYQYLYGNLNDPFQITAMRDISGTLTNYYYDEAGLLFGFKRGGAWYYVATDQVGSPKVVTGSSGQALKTTAYDAFGNKTADSNPAFDLPLGFAGGLADAATGLIRFGFRDYDPQAGVWTASDPIRFRGAQANLYVYARNDPINGRDPSGLFCIGGSAYAGIGAGGKFCTTDEGFSYCLEVGFGGGGGVEIDPFGGLDETGQNFGAEGSGKLGGLTGSVGGKLDKNGCTTAAAKVGLGPISYGVSSTGGGSEQRAGSVGVGNAGDLSKTVSNLIKEAIKDAWKQAKIGVGLEAKVNAEFCFKY